MKETMKFTAAAALVAGAMLAFASPANASLLTFSVLSDDAVVPQSSSAPCIICATQQAHNPDLFGFNNFISTGQTDGGNFFSTALVGGSLMSGDEAGAVPEASLLNDFVPGSGVDFTEWGLKVIQELSVTLLSRNPNRARSMAFIAIC